ncbi:GTP 3',8-cyclase MoaA [Flavobacterium sp. GSP27]|uniref:GTP 3',8-cyclase n=2 Tax=Flavobacterium TaxID=237 RepID=A0A432CPL2_9FLAO|nr:MULTISPECIES: GTP 3',8-cyclase MoaA [Flavobacterium]RTY69612.1 GTP 3',8-cyclase MoaA [Flavobacterium sp. LB2P53]RTY75256.1 GTP 3',8-cyclase MoaA [Flavobacterium sp. LS1R10]RTY80146.1 GTP 3',8-cyclase MoaA [Flavobacterium sp. LS1P28]RTZ05829.1 GTP 3',8-cyclase MoaA [Flavobacterium sp. GSP6]RTZ07029.1 GTP 3',8-cyclase MoaA [Flavobacterium bomense]
MIKDTFGRVHDYLRISLTDNCNLRCFYCMPEENYAFAPASKLMQVEEIETIAKLFVANGVKKIRLTGGEPLVRKDAPRIIESLGKLGVELAITTNGVRINEMLDELLAANIKAINISLDTLQADKFLKITRRDLYHRVRSNIELLLQHGIRVKINVVVMKGLNENEILDFIALTQHNTIEVRFIEFMPFSGNNWTSNQVFTLQEILLKVASKYDVLPVQPEPNDTSKKYMIPGHVGSFAVISTMSSPFCETCNRMRLTADGKLKNCLFSKEETDLLGALRAGQEILPLIEDTIMAKAKALGGQFSGVFEDIDASKLKNRSMITIGG